MRQNTRYNQILIFLILDIHPLCYPQWGVRSHCVYVALKNCGYIDYGRPKTVANIGHNHLYVGRNLLWLPNYGPPCKQGRENRNLEDDSAR